MAPPRGKPSPEASSPMSLLPHYPTFDRPDLFQGLDATGFMRSGRDGGDGSRRSAATWSPMASSPHRTDNPMVHVERLDPPDAAGHRDAWVALMGRALEPNVFLDPDFAGPAAQHLGAAQRPTFVMVWLDTAPGTRDLIAVCPVVLGRGPWAAMARAWSHELSALGFPLLDRRHAAIALEALLQWVGATLWRAHGLAFQAVPADGPTARLLFDLAAETRRPTAVIARWERAILRDDEAAGETGLSAKGAKERRRQYRRLAECGRLDYGSVTGGDALVDEVERFLALEAAGWKGRMGSALVNRPSQTAFARTMTRLLARRGLCRVDSLRLDGEPIAMGVILTAGRTDMFWKMAYREDLARFSPGVQFVAELTARQKAEGRAVSTDSCAMPDHPMIDRLWRGRLALANIAIATRPERAARFRSAVTLSRQGRSLRAVAKRVVVAWRRYAGIGRGSRPSPD